MTAEDAWFSIQRVADPKAPLSAGGQLSQIIDFDATKVVDETTLELVLNTPYAILDSLLAEYTLGIIPTDFDIANPVGTGAFAYKSFDPGKTSTFTKYADYWGDPAFVDELQIQDFADDSAKVNALQAGQIQTVDNLPYNLIETIKGAGGGVLVSDTGAWVPFTMRVDVAPFDDVRVRQAMRLIVDRQQMIDQTLSGYGSLGNDLYAPFDTAYASDLPQREQDIDQAKSLLAQAGAEGLQVELFTGDDIGSVGAGGGQPLRRAGEGRGRRGQGHQEDAVLRRRLPVLRVRPGLLEHPQLHPAGRRRHVPPGPGRHLQRDPLGQRGAPQPGQRRRQGARRGQADRAAPAGPADRVRRGRPDRLGLPSAGRRLRPGRAGHRGEQVPPARLLQVPERLGPVGPGANPVDDDIAAALPDPLAEVAPPKGQHGAAAWAMWIARRLRLALLTLLVSSWCSCHRDAGRPGRRDPRRLQTPTRGGWPSWRALLNADAERGLTAAWS